MSGFATPRRDKHGAWTGLGADIDKSIRARLARGDRICDVAEAVGVAEGYVRALATEGKDGPAPVPIASPPLARPPEPGTALSRVHCLVAGEEIGARECISRQCSQKCFCPKASFAINAIAPTVLPGTRLEDELARCRAVARSVLLKGSVEERHLGPALVALRGGKPVAAPLIAGELPAPPKRDEQAAVIAKLPRAPDLDVDLDDEPPAPRVTHRAPAVAAREIRKPDAAEIAAAVEATRALSIRTAGPATPGRGGSRGREENVCHRLRPCVARRQQDGHVLGVQ